VSYPHEDEPDGDVSLPHHLYIGVTVLLFGFVSVWPAYPATGATMALIGLLVAADDVLSHVFGIPTPLDTLWKKVIYPAIRRFE
jgi:hypothetical protein